MQAQRFDVASDHPGFFARGNDFRQGGNVAAGEYVARGECIGRSRPAHAADRVQKHYSVVRQQRAAFGEEGPVMRWADMLEHADGDDPVEPPLQVAVIDQLELHAIGHARMATESDVDIANAHPYWAYPFPDVAVVHNGQLTNYHQWKRRLERAGHRFQSECDSEIIAVYLAERMAQGDSLEESMRRSLDELDGVFTYICVTEEALGVAKDELGAKPLVLYESDDLVALASEEIAIRKVVDREIETYDPYEGEVLVWTR